MMPNKHRSSRGCIVLPACALQLIAAGAGSVPVIRAIGGLRDTVLDMDCDEARAAGEMEGSSA